MEEKSWAVLISQKDTPNNYSHTQKKLRDRQIQRERGCFQITHILILKHQIITHTKKNNNRDRQREREGCFQITHI